MTVLSIGSPSLPFVKVPVVIGVDCAWVGSGGTTRARLDSLARTESTRRALSVANDTLRNDSLLPVPVSVTVRLKSDVSLGSRTSWSIVAVSFAPHAPGEAATRSSLRAAAPRDRVALSLAFAL